MFARFFGWYEPRPSAQFVPIQTPEVVKTIISMLYTEQPLENIFACIDAASIDDLNQPLKTYGFHSEHAYAPLLRHLRRLQRYPNSNSAYYAAIEQHLLDKGVKQDALYVWLREKDQVTSENVESSDSEDEHLIDVPFLPDTSLQYVILRYLHAVQSDRQLGNERGRNIARLKGLIDELSIPEINQPVYQRPDFTLLHYAASLGDAEMTEYLIKRGANVNIGAKYRLYMTPLLYALARASIADCNVNIMQDINAAVNILLANSADPHAKTYLSGGTGNVIGRTDYGDNESALNICMKTDNYTMAICLLKDHNVDPHAVESRFQAKIDDFCKACNP